MRELSMHVLDLLQNAVEAGATEIRLSLDEDSREDRLTIRVADNGRGMAPETLCEVTDPFYTSRRTRRVGLGLPLLAAAAERCNGSLKVASALAVGTTVTATFQLSNIDRAPLGDMASTLLSVMLQQSPVALSYHHRVNEREFEFATPALAAALGEVPFSHPAVIRWLREFLAEGFADLYGGGADAQSANN
ncbi:MAG: ATP-binding protein [Chloroflexota bacterium]